MSAEAAAFVRSWAVGRYRVTLSVPKVRQGECVTAVMEWEPSIPQRLTPREIETYRAGRDSALKELGLLALVVDL